MQIIPTSAGPVEILTVPGDRPPVLFFPGGHCSALTDCGWSVYTDAGYGVVSFSRPGYGGTRVGARDAAAFEPLIAEVCDHLGVTATTAVGVSFGGLQAVHAAADSSLGIRRLALHSCAPSTLPFPDSRAAAIGGPIMFSRLLQGVTWSLISRMVRSDAGLRRMLGALSRLPIDQWWPQLNDADKRQARLLFQGMRSDAGFVNDLRQGRAGDADARRAVFADVHCSTLVTGSPFDGGVAFAHAEDLAAMIAGAELIELDSPSHLFWIGAGRQRVVELVASFLTAGTR
ncbi:alpha/beta fold hydrolase [Glaciibacter flavus]|uniref:alpha/beta fold hydrolase n=1 Tax=Orlajensenia flava TaxID=2565934 RepID=UPI003AFF75CD